MPIFLLKKNLLIYKYTRTPSPVMNYTEKGFLYVVVVIFDVLGQQEGLKKLLLYIIFL